MRKVVISLALFALLVAGVFGSDKILVYISGPEKLVSAVEAAFEKKNGDVVDVYHTGSGPLQQKVFTEMMAGSIQADIIWGAEPLMYYSLKNAGVLQVYYPEHYDLLPDGLKMGDGYFTATGVRYGTLIVNNTKLSKEEFPVSWADLKREDFRDQLAMADASQSAMAFALFAALLKVDGGAGILQMMGENGVFVTKMNMDAISVVQSGEKSVCIAPSDGAYRLIKSDRSKGLTSSLSICWPSEGAFVIQRPIALVKKSRSERQLDTAKRFMDFALSEECQRLSAQFGFETVRNDLDFVLFENMNKLSVDWQALWINQDEILEEYSEWFM